MLPSESPCLHDSDESSNRVLMQVTGLRKSFGGQVILDGVDLELREGEVVLLRGENGSGKTTLLNILTGNMEPDAGEINLFVNSHPEHFRFPRRWWQDMNPWDHFTPERVASEGVGRTWQDTRLFGSQTLLDNLAVASPDQPGEKPWRILARPRCWHASEAQNQQSVQTLLDTLGLGDRSISSADMISLGQTKRIAFARCARANSKIIFLDEPLGGLDQKGTASIIALLRELAAAHRLTLVIVEHVFNIPLILDFSTTVWTLANGHLTRETIAEAKADPSVRDTHDMSSTIRQLAGPDAIITEESLPRGAILTRVTQPGTTREPLLTIKGLVARRGRRLVVGEEQQGQTTGLDLTIHKGELVFLQAPNGWGKTSLLDTLAGVLPSEKGSIELSGKSLTHLSTWERRHNGLAVIPAYDNVFNSLTIGEYQRISAGPNRRFDQKGAPENQKISKSRMVSSLSGGERKRLVLNAAHGQDAKVKIWDEPFSSLDAASVANLAGELLPQAQTAGLILIPSMHQFGEA
ncbi:MAG: ATP-binding cassette domain-containing protein [Verrucomicrobia bacterium]|nr:ATP-binding cassette domain-containing protein [Verrucomicrobiota bacterium]MCH8510944.1 ATP-binding cassette domain-containing protein [Kiritimatiellia bacterium]